ncbi:MAG TPA: hypothetical protein VMT53_01555 [Terriglobales bacterium]|nr:hypothetical protein [Terriglobales bacterium]
MAVRGLGLNRFERLLFWAALVLGGLLLLIRVGAVVILGFVHHH